MTKALEELGNKTGSERGLVRFALVHLSGSWRGKTEEFEVNRLTVGSDPTNDITFDPLRDPAVSPQHAEFSVEHCDLVLRDKGSDGGTFVNNQCITEIILQDNDLVMFGQGGPKFGYALSPMRMRGASRCGTSFATAEILPQPTSRDGLPVLHSSSGTF